MHPTCLETMDIFRGAYLLASGGDLAEIRVGTNGKRIATFMNTGNDLDRLGTTMDVHKYIKIS